MTIEMDLSDVRRDYEAHGITRKEMDPDPFVQFGRWLQRARELNPSDRRGYLLSTVYKINPWLCKQLLLLRNYNQTFAKTAPSLLEYH